MTRIVLLAILLFLPSPGSERWDIKTLADGFQPSGVGTPSTIAAERKLKAPKWSESLARQPLEKVTVVIAAKIVACGVETDSDIHLDISDGKRTMVAEIPKPEYANPKYRTIFETARAWVCKHVARLGAIHSITPIACTITGVRFFDKPDHGKGGAPNGVEVHPVLGIK